MAENSVDTVGSPLWWMARLARKQSGRTKGSDQSRLQRLEELKKWMSGDPPLPEGAPDWERAYSAFHKKTRTNYAQLITDSARERMTPTGFLTGASSDDDTGDAAAERVWTENNMQVQQTELLDNMLGLSEGYLMIGAPRPRSTVATITVEDPLSVVTAHDPIDPWKIRAAMKQYRDEDYDQDVTWIYIAGQDGERATAARAVRAGAGKPWSVPNTNTQNSWRWEYFDCPTDKVPFVRFLNLRGQADFEPHIDLLGRLNHTTLQRMLIAEIQAFRQRAVKGLPEFYPADFSVPELRGKKIDYSGIFTPGAGALWRVPAGVDFWESQPIDLRPLLDSEDRDIRKLSAVTHMPVAYFNPDTANSSAEGASFQREGLVYRVEDRQDIATVCFAQAMAMAFETVGDTARADMTKIQTLWEPIERLSLGERYSAAAQAKAAGLADKTIRREILGWSPSQIRRAQADDATQAVADARKMAQQAAVAARFSQQTNPAQNRPTDQQQNGQPARA